MGWPNLFFFFSPTDAIQIIRGIKPIIVIAKSCNQPDLPRSCNLLEPAAIEGKKVAIIDIQYITPDPLVSPIDASQTDPTNPHKVANK